MFNISFFSFIFCSLAAFPFALLLPLLCLFASFTFACLLPLLLLACCLYLSLVELKKRALRDASTPRSNQRGSVEPQVSRIVVKRVATHVDTLARAAELKADNSGLWPHAVEAARDNKTTLHKTPEPLHPQLPLVNVREQRVPHQ